MTTTFVSNPLEEQDVYAFPVSFAQQRLWFLDQLHPQSAAYNLFSTVRISVPLNIDALEQSLHMLIQRHEVMRTIFVMRDGQPMQMIVPHVKVPLQVVDLEHLPETQREAEVLGLANAEVQRPFDLARGPLLRTMLFRLRAEEYLLLLTIHHIIFDGWSMNVFLRELSTLYQAVANGQPAALPELPIQYADFAVWQRERLQDEVLEEQLAYWKKHLTGARTTLELPSDRPRPAGSALPGSMHLFRFSKSLTYSLKALSRQEGVSLFTTLVAAFQTLLYRYTGQDDLLLGTDTADRSQAGTEDLIGFFVNTLVLRSDLSGNPTFRELLGRVREVIVSALAHEDVPFEYLVKELRPERNLSQNPLFQVLLTLEPPLTILPSGWTLTQMDVTVGTSKFDLSLELDDRPEGLIGRFEYNTDLFDAATIDRMVGHWQTLLEAISTCPALCVGELPILTGAERQQLLVEWNATDQAYQRDFCIHRLIEEQVECTPDSVAVVYEDEQITYFELNARANRLAHYLRQMGVGPDVLVGLCVERSVEMVVGLLGILKAGGAYVPLDPTFPSERLAFMLEDYQASLLLTQQRLLGQLSSNTARVVCLDAHDGTLEQQNDANPASLATSENLAYVIYTSGSTGRPKGVQIPHRAVVNFLKSMQKEPGLTAEDTLLSVTTLSFDIAALELYLPLMVGARLVITSRDIVTNGAALAETLRRTHASVMQATPITWRLLLALSLIHLSEPTTLLSISYAVSCLKKKKPPDEAPAH